MPMRGRLPSEASRMMARPTPRLVPESPTLSATDDPAADVTELLGDVAQRRHHAELAEARRQRNDRDGHDGRIGPAMEPEGRGRGRRRIGLLDRRRRSSGSLTALPRAPGHRRASARASRSRTSASEVWEKSAYHSPTA